MNTQTLEAAARIDRVVEGKRLVWLVKGELDDFTLVPRMVKTETLEHVNHHALVKHTN